MPANVSAVSSGSGIGGSPASVSTCTATPADSSAVNQRVSRVRLSSFGSVKSVMVSGGRSAANFVMASGGKLIEIQGTGEQRAFSREEFNALMDLAHAGCEDLFAAQRKALGL